MKWWEDPEKIKQRAENYRKNFRKKYGVDNPQQLKDIKNKTTKTCENKYGGIGYAGSAGKKSKKKTKELFGSDNIMKTESGKKLFREGMKKKFGVENVNQLDEYKENLSIKVKKRIEENGHWHKGKTYEEIMGKKRAAERKKELKKSGAYGQSITPKISVPQLKLFEIVKQKYPTAILEYPVLDYCLDIAVPELKLDFEYDGSYWHDPEKDKKRDEVLDMMGWKVTRFIDDLPNKI